MKIKLRLAALLSLISILAAMLFSCAKDPAKCDHKYSSSVSREASCVLDGERVYTCSECGSSYTEKIAAKGHDLTEYSEKAPGCTTMGWDAYVICKVCAYNTYVPKSAVGHSYEIETVAPTCTEQGYDKHVCDCGDTYYSNMTDALEHSFSGGVCGVCGALE
jgi:hypothetical protein